MSYVSTAGAPTDACVFCAALARRDNRTALILRRSERAFLILNAFPYASGHLMAALTRHAAGIEDAEPAELAECLTLVQVAIRALAETYRPDGFNVGVNQGRVAGAGVPGHLHIHVVPRWSGDTNFMPVIGETRVLPETLDATYERLSVALRS